MLMALRWTKLLWVCWNQILSPWHFLFDAQLTALQLNPNFPFPHCQLLQLVPFLLVVDITTTSVTPSERDAIVSSGNIFPMLHYYKAFIQTPLWLDMLTGRNGVYSPPLRIIFLHAWRSEGVYPHPSTRLSFYSILGDLGHPPPIALFSFSVIHSASNSNKI